MNPLATTERLLLRSWDVEDAKAALAIYGVAEVTRWLTPVMGQVDDVTAMRSLLQRWIAEQPEQLPPRGRWAVQRRDNDEVIGGVAIRLLPPYEEDLELSWQLRPEAWGFGYASEAARGLARWAFTQDIDELFAVARPNNTRAIATAQRVGMQWVGETTKYYDLRLQVFRLRATDLPDEKSIAS
jgi:RimJ/RimL family protein N-acetyltransferase